MDEIEKRGEAGPAKPAVRHPHADGMRLDEILDADQIDDVVKAAEDSQPTLVYLRTRRPRLADFEE